MRSCLQIIPDEEMREIREQYDLLLSRGLSISDTLMCWAKEYLKLIRKVRGRYFLSPEALKAMPYVHLSSRGRDYLTLLLREERNRMFNTIPLIPPHPLPVRMDGVVGDYAKGTEKLIN